MTAQITEIIVRSGDITQISLQSTEITSVPIQSGDTTVLKASAATINAASLSLSNSLPSDITRSASAGIQTTVSRSDHIHSMANTLLDGGNY
jgi:hypothetical protein